MNMNKSWDEDYLGVLCQLLSIQDKREWKWVLLSIWTVSLNRIIVLHFNQRNSVSNTHTHTHSHMQANTHTHTHTLTHICMHTHTQASACTHTQASTHARAHTHKQTNKNKELKQTYFTLSGLDHGVLKKLDQHQVLQLQQVLLVGRIHSLEVEFDIHIEQWWGAVWHSH